MQKLLFLFTFLTIFGFGSVSAQDNPEIAKRNKTLFDQTVEKVNFRTIEFVYDRKFPRKKFPANQTNFKIRKTFDDFDGNAAFKKLFMNYNDVSEKFKNKFGKGKNDLATFEKALSDILINKDFEFFISSLNKDDKITLIRSLQQINKKGVAQFIDAAGKPRGFFASDSVIEESVDPIVKPKNVTTATENVTPDEELAEADTTQPVINTNATPEEVFQQKAPRRDWLSWLALLFSVGALALAAAVKLKDIPEVRSYVANNFQKKGESAAVITKTGTAPEANPDLAFRKQLDNLTREVEGLYAQMDELLHKNTVLEQKLTASQPKPFDLPQKKQFLTEPEPAVTPKRENTPKPVEPAPVPPVAAPVNAAPPVQHDPASENLHAKNEPTQFTSFSVAQEPTPAQPSEIPAESTMYLNKPDSHGFFWNDEVTRSFVPNQSLFVMTVAENDKRKALFQVTNDPALQKLAIENQELYLNPVCDVQGEAGQKLETLSPGTIILNGDQWVLVKKATIRLV